jgi:HAD superfamily hydrolase (TIGR01509 family)
VAALILDFDGLIVDTETPVFEEWQAVFRRHGHDLGLDDWQHTIGTDGGFDPCASLEALTGASLDREAIEREVAARHRARCLDLPLLPGVAALLDDGARLGLPSAVASSSGAAWVEGWLSHHGIRGKFAAVVTRDDVSRVKPAPDLFLLAAARLGVDPEVCLVFEDSPNGMRAARAAHMTCVAAPNGLTRSLVLPGPDLVVASLAELPLEALLRRLDRAARPRGGDG